MLNLFTNEAIKIVVPNESESPQSATFDTALRDTDAVVHTVRFGFIHCYRQRELTMSVVKSR